MAGIALAMRGVAQWLDMARGQDTTPYQDLDRRSIPAFDRWAIGFYSPASDRLSTVLAGAEFAVPLAINLWDIHTGQEPTYGVITDLLLYAEVYGFSSSLAIYAKALKVHPRPLAFTAKAPASARASGDAASGFFSAHTTSAFAAAVFTGCTFAWKHPQSPWVPWVWGGMLTAATTVGVMRITAGKHFPSDVAMGAAVGSLSGYLIPRLHLNPVAKTINREGVGKKAAAWEVGPELAFVPGWAGPVPGLRLRF